MTTPSLHERARELFKEHWNRKEDAFDPIKVVEEIVELVKSETLSLAQEAVPGEKKIDKKYSTDERRYPHGFNTCRKETLLALSKLR